MSVLRKQVCIRKPPVNSLVFKDFLKKKKLIFLTSCNQTFHNILCMATFRYKKAIVCIAILYIITVVCNCAGKTDTEIGYQYQSVYTLSCIYL